MSKPDGINPMEQNNCLNGQVCHTPLHDDDVLTEANLLASLFLHNSG